MGASQSTQTITGIEVKGNLEGNPTVNIYNTTNPTAETKPKVWKPFCTVTAPTLNFVGREDLVAKIHHQIQQCSLENEYSKKTLVIHGLGGMGKSELVRKYVQTYRQDPIILNAAWIDAESENSLESSFKSLGDKLKIKTEDQNVNELVSSIYNHLDEHNQSSLFIFDNAEQMRSKNDVFGIFEFLPTVQLDNIPLIIITTRVNNWEIPEENIIQINELSEDAAVEFLTKRWRLSAEQKNDKAIMDALKNLAQNLQCFPLGLTLAASNIPISKLRSIPKEIKDYIQKLNGPNENWIHEGHSTGTASKYDLIMNNVWAATLKKVESHGHIGEAAISILNIMAYLPPDHITVEGVVEVAEFTGLSSSMEGFEMLDTYSLLSLPWGKNRMYQRIRIHRLVQRCTRDNLDREKNYTYLLNISRFIAPQKYSFFHPQAIHQQLKERTWPKNSIRFSIIFASKRFEEKVKFKILKDIIEVLVLEAKPCCTQNLTEDYKMLHALNLFYVSTCSERCKELCKNLISKDPFYSGKYLEQVFLSSLGKCVKGLFMATMDTEDLVNRAIIRVIKHTLTAKRYQLTLSQEVEEEISLILVDATGNSFEGSVETVGKLYIFLWNIYCCYKRMSGSWYAETAFKIHASVYASFSGTEGRGLSRYWENDMPIPHGTIVRVLKNDQSGERSNRLAELYRTEAGLQILLHHLQYLDAQSQPKTDTLSTNFCGVLELFTALGWKWNCTKEFVQVILFMETLYSLTKNVFEFNAKYCDMNQFLCLMTWFGLFGKNTFVDRTGVSWSIQSVAKEMVLFLDIADRDGRRRRFNICLDREAKAMLEEFIASSGSDQEGIAVKTATRMLEWL